MLVKFQTIQQKPRFNEWVAGICLLVWGLITYSHPGSFNSTGSHYKAFLNLASQETLSLIAFTIGFSRVIFLSIIWKYAPIFRIIFSVLSSIFWAALWTSYVSLGIIPNLATIGALLILDIYSAWFAGSDASKAKNDKYYK